MRAKQLSFAPVVVSGATATVNDAEIVSCTRTIDGPCTITIHDDMKAGHRPVIIKDTGQNANTNNITVEAQTGDIETITGAMGASFVMSTDGQAITFAYFDAETGPTSGAGWRQIA